MTLSGEERTRILASLRSDTVFRDEVRREPLDTELVSLPGRLSALAETVRRLAESVDGGSSRSICGSTSSTDA